LDHIISPGADDGPIVVIYRHAEGIERVASLAGLPVLDLIARNELPNAAVSQLPAHPPGAPALSAVRRLSGATMLDPRAPETLAQALGFAYLPLDDTAINPEIGFLILRAAPGNKSEAPEGRAKSNLLWDVGDDIFDCMALQTDAAEVAARMYRERPKAHIAHSTSPAAPHGPQPLSPRRGDPAPK